MGAFTHPPTRNALKGDTLDIDECPNLKESLGKVGTDRVRYHLHGTGRSQPAASNVPNTVMAPMRALRRRGNHRSLYDILAGTINAITQRSDEMSATRLFQIFELVPILNTREIQRMTGLGERQAQKYMRAAKLALPILVRHFEKREEDHDRFTE